MQSAERRSAPSTAHHAKNTELILARLREHYRKETLRKCPNNIAVPTTTNESKPLSA